MFGNREYGSAAVEPPWIFEEEEAEEAADYRTLSASCPPDDYLDYEGTRQLLLRTSAGIYGGNREVAEREHA